MVQIKTWVKDCSVLFHLWMQFQVLTLFGDLEKVHLFTLSHIPATLSEHASDLVCSPDSATEAGCWPNPEYGSGRLAIWTSSMFPSSPSSTTSFQPGKILWLPCCPSRDHLQALPFGVKSLECYKVVTGFPPNLDVLYIPYNDLNIFIYKSETKKQHSV